MTDSIQGALRTAVAPDGLPTLGEMMMFRLYRAWSAGNPIFTRLCEGRFNITRREWRLLAIAVQHASLTSTQLAHAAALDAPRTSRAVSSLCGKRSEERRVGKECVSTCSSRWAQYQQINKTIVHSMTHT